MKLYLAMFMSALLFISLNAQEWDEISDAELMMTEFQEWPEAHAVILFDIGDLKITREFELVITQHVRIKILTEEGKESADIAIPFREYDDIVDLEAHAYTPQGDEFELDDDDIHYQELDDLSLCRFSIPGVEVGSVIEYQYQIVREYIHFLDPWYFQNDSYTVLSQITVSLQPGFNYTAFPSNVSLYDYQFAEEEYWDIDTQKKNKKFIWKAQNIPPLKREKFMFNINDYMAKLYFQLVSYKDPYQSYTFIESWDDLGEKIYQAFEQSITMDSGLEEFTLDLIVGLTDKQEIINRLYNFMADSIKTIDDVDLWDFKTPDIVLESREGLPSSKNLMLLNMLGHAGIKADIVMISTRPHGRIYLDLPQLRQFNHFLVLVDINNNPVYLDTADEFCPPGVLAADCNVTVGLLVDEESAKITKIHAKDVKSMTHILSEITLNQGGILTANSTFKLQGYPAADARGEIKSGSLHDFGEKQLKKSFEEFILDSIWIEKQKDPGTLVFHMNYQLKNFAEDAGEMLYLPAPLFTKNKSNPLKTPKRLYPVDYSNTFSELESVKIKLADNMSIVELPRKVKDNSRYASYSSFIFKGKNSFELNRHFAIKKVSFQPSEYKELKRIYDSMTSSDQNQFVISVK